MFHLGQRSHRIIKIMAKDSKTKDYLGIATTWQDLLDSNSAMDLKMRIFNTVAGSSIIGIVQEETEDSFLVVLPAKLMLYGEEPNQQKVIEPHVPLPFTRMMKSTIMIVMPIFGEYEFYYTQYVRDIGEKTIVGLLGEDYYNRLEIRVGNIIEAFKAVAKEIAKERAKIAEKVAKVEASEQAEDEMDAPILPPAYSKMKH